MKLLPLKTAFQNTLNTNSIIEKTNKLITEYNVLNNGKTHEMLKAINEADIEYEIRDGKRHYIVGGSRKPRD